MTQLSRGILAAVAISLSLGAVAWGRDLVAVSQDPAGAPEAAINQYRQDRSRRHIAGAGPDPDDRAAAGCACRYLGSGSHPVAKAARTAPSGPMINKSGDRKLAVACEPPVSV